MDYNYSGPPQSPEFSSHNPYNTHYRRSVSHGSPYSNQSPYATSKTSSVNPYANQSQSPYINRRDSVSKPKRELDDDDDDDWVPDAPHAPVPAQPAKQNSAVMAGGASDGRALPPGLADGIEVKTKFPVARIKRIMQADEDVGKVAQVTPVAVSKALELFMISLVTKSAIEAKTRGSKRVGAAHLKQAVVKDEQFDFLTEIVSKVPDAAPAQGKHEADHSDEADVGPKKKGRARRKKKKEDDDI